MTKSLSVPELTNKLKELLRTDDALDFLLQLKQSDLEKLVAIVRERLEEKT